MSSAAALLLLPLISAAAILFGLKRNANVSALLATGSAVVTFVLSVMLLTSGQSGVAELLNWSQVGSLRLGIDLKVDALSSGMMIVVTGVVSEGLSTTVFPAASAGASFQTAIING